MALDADPVLDDALRKFVRTVVKRIPEGKTYTLKADKADDDIRVKWDDRGTQKMIKIYDGRMKLPNINEIFNS